MSKQETLILEMTAVAGTTEYNSIDFSVQFKTTYADLTKEALEILGLDVPISNDVYIIRVFKVEGNEQPESAKVEVSCNCCGEMIDDCICTPSNAGCDEYCVCCGEFLLECSCDISKS